MEQIFLNIMGTKARNSKFVKFVIFLQLVRRHRGFCRRSHRQCLSLMATQVKPSSRRVWWLRTRRPRAAPAPITLHRRRRPRMRQRVAGQPPASNSGATTTTAGESFLPLQFEGVSLSLYRTASKTPNKNTLLLCVQNI